VPSPSASELRAVNPVAAEHVAGNLARTGVEGDRDPAGAGAVQCQDGLIAKDGRVTRTISFWPRERFRSSLVRHRNRTSARRCSRPNRGISFTTLDHPQEDGVKRAWRQNPASDSSCHIALETQEGPPFTGPSLMARPGLEPGTPRFSVVGQDASSTSVIPATEQFPASKSCEIYARKLRSFLAGLGTQMRAGA